MKGFEPVTFTWRGAEYTVPAKGQLRAIADVEDALMHDGMSAIQVLMRKGGPGNARLADAAARAIRHGGGAVSEEDVYLSMQEGIAKGDNAALLEAQGLILSLIDMVAPSVGAWLKDGPAVEDDGGKKTQAAG